MSKRQPKPKLYGVGRNLDHGIEVLGMVKGAGDALEAVQAARRELGGPDVGTLPWRALTREQRRQARAGSVVEV